MKPQNGEAAIGLDGNCGKTAMHLHFPKSTPKVIDYALTAIVYAIMLGLAVGATIAMVSLLVDLVLSAL